MSKDMTDAGTLPAASLDESSGELRRRWRYLVISLAILVLDQWTKWLVEIHLHENHSTIEVIPDLLNFTHVRNTGVAFGLFAANGNPAGTWVLTALGFAALAFVGYYFKSVHPEDRVLLVALALVMGGAVGNLLDRIMSGGVTDFIDFYVGTYHWHTFNVADSAITIGISLMVLSTFRRGPEPDAGSPAAGTSDADDA